jgi:hypothetical protein
MNYTDQQLINMAHNNPKELSRLLISPNADIKLLTSGAEILGSEVTDERIVAPVLLQLLKHVHASVREGAVIGASSFYLEKMPPQDILDRLMVIASSDPSPPVKDSAKILVKDIEKLK